MENWRFIEGTDCRYMVSDAGRVASFKRGGSCFHKAKNSSMGYASVGICMKGIITQHLVHRLVAKAFLPNPKNLPMVNHLDGNKANNRADNLEWCDQYENFQHALLHGLVNFKAKPCGVLNEAGEVVRRYPSVSAMCRAENFSIATINTQLRVPAVCGKYKNVVTYL